MEKVNTEQDSSMEEYFGCGVPSGRYNTKDCVDNFRIVIQLKAKNPQPMDYYFETAIGTAAAFAQAQRINAKFNDAYLIWAEQWLLSKNRWEWFL